MNNEALKAWLDAMPIDDVRRRIERLEAKLADLRVLERIYEDRHGAARRPTRRRLSQPRSRRRRRRAKRRPTRPPSPQPSGSRAADRARRCRAPACRRPARGRRRSGG